MVLLPLKKPVTITVNDVDEAPVFTEGDTTTRTIPETPVGTPFAPANVGLAEWSPPMRMPATQSLTL